MNIAVLLGSVMYENQAELFAGISESAKTNRVNVFLFTYNISNDKNIKYKTGEYNIYNLPDFKRYDGIIADFNTIRDIKVANQLIYRIKESGTPAISIGRKYEGLYYIGIEESKAMCQLTSHLVEEHHCRKFYYISGVRENHDEAVRRKSLIHTLGLYGISMKPEHIFQGNFSPESGKDAIEYFLGLGEPLADVIVAANDLMAVEACMELERNGISIPEQVIVTGFDGIKDAFAYSPRITTIKRPRFEVGYEAVRWFAKGYVNGQPWYDKELPCQLILNESCGCKEHMETTDEMFRRSHIIKKYNKFNLRNLLEQAAAELTEVQDYDELIVSMKRYIKMLNPDSFYLCMCSSRDEMENRLSQISLGFLESEKDISSFSERSHIYIAYEKGEFTEEYQGFSTSSLLPDGCIMPSQGDYYVVSPVHFKNRCYGYMVFKNSDFAAYSEVYNLFRTILGTNLENIRKRMLLSTMVKRLEKKWVLDPLTGVYNRNGFFQNADHIVEQCRKERKKVGIFFLDIDGLKLVNDQYGHDQGDFLIRTVAHVLGQSCKTDHIIMRYGGDEFVLLTSEYGELEAKNFLRRIEEGMRYCNDNSNKPYEISVSVGYILATPEEEFSIKEMISLADKKMYQAKHSHKYVV